MVHAPEKQDAEKLHDMLSRKYNQDAVIHVRNGHGTLNFKDGKIQHANVNTDLEAGEQLDDNYTNVDGQKFRINFK